LIDRIPTMLIFRSKTWLLCQ